MLLLLWVSYLLRSLNLNKGIFCYALISVGVLFINGCLIY